MSNNCFLAWALFLSSPSDCLKGHLRSVTGFKETIIQKDLGIMWMSISVFGMGPSIMTGIKRLTSHLLWRTKLRYFQVALIVLFMMHACTSANKDSSAIKLWSLWHWFETRESVFRLMSGLNCAGKHITLLLIQPHCALLTPLTDALKQEKRELVCLCAHTHVGVSPN